LFRWWSSSYVDDHRRAVFLLIPLPLFRRHRRLNPENGHPVAANSNFESIFGPLYKFREWDFADAASADVNPIKKSNDADAETNRSRFRAAIDSVRRWTVASLIASSSTTDAEEDAPGNATAKIRNVEMLALGTNDAGLPVRRHFDWTIGSVMTRSLESDDDDDGDSGGLPSSVVIMYGDVVNEAESSDR
jgi:hypothetical protein